jgi:hypothetical protein
MSTGFVCMLGQVIRCVTNWSELVCCTVAVFILWPFWLWRDVVWLDVTNVPGNPLLLSTRARLKLCNGTYCFIASSCQVCCEKFCYRQPSSLVKYQIYRGILDCWTTCSILVFGGRSRSIWLVYGLEVFALHMLVIIHIVTLYITSLIITVIHFRLFICP